MSHDLDTLDRGGVQADDRPAGALEHRSAEVVDVSFPRRVIDLIVMPYEQATWVPHQGRMIQEVCSRGAFDGIERRSNRIKLYREHDNPRDLIGRAVALHPARPEGLVAQVRVSKTQAGDDALTQAADGDLGASAGFLPMDGGEVWETRSLRRLVKAWLGHIALVAEPAYPGAEVLAVRAANDVGAAPASTTPNRDEIGAWLLERRLASLDGGRPAA